jgi:hypothetical protein
MTAESLITLLAPSGFRTGGARIVVRLVVDD